MDFDLIHRRNTYKYLRQIERAYEELISKASTLALKTKLKKELFEFRKHPKITKEIEEALQQYYKEVRGAINMGVESEWLLANEKYDALRLITLERISKKAGENIQRYELYNMLNTSHNEKALQSFQHRKVGDFTTSDRVWNITSQIKSELEFAIDVSLAEGQSANQLARQIKKYLNEPDRLYRRVRDKHGNLVLSKNAKYYKPGQGVYRSSFKNALRLAKEEINTAYRESEGLRIMQNNDVVGIEICLSPSHKIYDICDELKGKYPKDFKWNKWHIGCMCHRKTILKSDEELIKELQQGEYLPSESSKNFVNDVPNKFKTWLNENEDKFKNWKRKPSFIEENGKYVKTKEFIESRRKDFLKLAKDPNYQDVLFDERNGGLKAIHKDHNMNPKALKYEREVQNILFKRGDKVILEDESDKKIKGKKVDGFLNEHSFDISTILGEGKNTVVRALLHSKSKKAEIALLYFPNKTNYTAEILERSIKRFNGQTDYRFEKILIIIENKIIE